MNIIKKEILEFSKNETDALQLVTEMCVGLMREATHPHLRDLAQRIYYDVSELWGWEE
jgi:hypothetical protein